MKTAENKINSPPKNFLFINRDYSSNTNKNISADLFEALQDSRTGKNLHGPFDTAEEAVTAMLED